MTSELYFAGIIAIRDEAFVEAADKIRTDLSKSTLAIANPHMTLLLPSQLKAVKAQGLSTKEMKRFINEVIEEMPAPPDVGTSLLVQRADRDDKHTYFLRVINQDEMQHYLNILTDFLMIPRVERYFHVSIANNTGKANESIADICADDCVGVNA